MADYIKIWILLVLSSYRTSFAKQHETANSLMKDKQFAAGNKMDTFTQSKLLPKYLVMLSIINDTIISQNHAISKREAGVFNNSDWQYSWNKTGSLNASDTEIDLNGKVLEPLQSKENATLDTKHFDPTNQGHRNDGPLPNEKYEETDTSNSGAEMYPAFNKTDSNAKDDGPMSYDSKAKTLPTIQTEQLPTDLLNDTLITIERDFQEDDQILYSTSNPGFMNNKGDVFNASLVEPIKKTTAVILPTIPITPVHNSMNETFESEKSNTWNITPVPTSTENHLPHAQINQNVNQNEQDISPKPIPQILKHSDKSTPENLTSTSSTAFGIPSSSVVSTSNLTFLSTTTTITTTTTKTTTATSSYIHRIVDQKALERAIDNTQKFSSTPSCVASTDKQHKATTSPITTVQENEHYYFKGHKIHRTEQTKNGNKTQDGRVHILDGYPPHHSRRNPPGRLKRKHLEDEGSVSNIGRGLNHETHVSMQNKSFFSIYGWVLSASILLSSCLLLLTGSILLCYCGNKIQKHRQERRRREKYGEYERVGSVSSLVSSQHVCNHSCDDNLESVSMI